MAAADQSPSDPSVPSDPSASTGPDASTEAEHPAEAEHSADAEHPAAEPADVKARFRDALERKKSQHADGVAGGGPSSAKIHDVHSRAGGKRQFRRKSGG